MASVCRHGCPPKAGKRAAEISSGGKWQIQVAVCESLLERICGRRRRGDPEGVNMSSDETQIKITHLTHEVKPFFKQPLAIYIYIFFFLPAC